MILVRIHDTLSKRVTYTLVADEEAFEELAESSLSHFVLTGRELTADPEAPLPWAQNRCDGCQHWQITKDKWADTDARGICLRADRTDRFWVSDEAYLTTEAAFGCVQWSQKEPKDA